MEPTPPSSPRHTQRQQFTPTKGQPEKQRKNWVSPLDFTGIRAEHERAPILDRKVATTHLGADPKPNITPTALPKENRTKLYDRTVSIVANVKDPAYVAEALQNMENREGWDLAYDIEDLGKKVVLVRDHTKTKAERRLKPESVNQIITSIDKWLKNASPEVRENALWLIDVLRDKRYIKNEEISGLKKEMERYLKNQTNPRVLKNANALIGNLSGRQYHVSSFGPHPVEPHVPSQQPKPTREDVEGLQNDNLRLQDELDKMRNAVNDVKKENYDLQVKIDTQRRKFTETLKEQAGRNTELERELNEQKEIENKKLNELETTNETLLKKKSELESENDDLVDIATELEKTNTVLKQQIQLEQQTYATLVKFEELTAKNLERADDKIHILYENNLENIKLIEDLRGEAFDLRSENEKMKTSLANLIKEVDRNATGNEELNNKVRELQEQSQMLNKEIKEKNKEIAELSDKNRKLEIDNRRVRASNKGFNEAKSEINQLKTKNNELEKELEEVESSRKFFQQSYIKAMYANADLVLRNQEYSRRMGELESQMIELKSKSEAIIREHNALDELLRNKQIENKKLEEEIRILKKQKPVVIGQDQITDPRLQNRLRELEEKSRKLEEELKNKENEVSEQLKTDRVKLSQEFDQSVISAMEENLAPIRVSIDSERSRLSKERIDLEQKEKEFAEKTGKKVTSERQQIMRQQKQIQGLKEQLNKLEAERERFKVQETEILERKEEITQPQQTTTSTRNLEAQIDELMRKNTSLELKIIFNKISETKINTSSISNYLNLGHITVPNFYQKESQEINNKNAEIKSLTDKIKANFENIQEKLSLIRQFPKSSDLRKSLVSLRQELTEYTDAMNQINNSLIPLVQQLPPNPFYRQGQQPEAIKDLKKESEANSEYISSLREAALNLDRYIETLPE